MSPVVVIYLIWGVWFLTWLVTVVMSSHIRGALNAALSALFHLAGLGALVLLLELIQPLPATDLRYGLWPTGIPDGPGWCLVVAASGCLVLAIWASAHRVTQRARIVDTGPYAVVRHPLHLAATLAAAITALLFGQPTSAIGAALFIAVLITKVVLEDHARDDPAHRDYRKRVPMLVPFWPTRF